MPIKSSTNCHYESKFNQKEDGAGAFIGFNENVSNVAK